MKKLYWLFSLVLLASPAFAQYPGPGYPPSGGSGGTPTFPVLAPNSADTVAQYGFTSAPAAGVSHTGVVTSFGEYGSFGFSGMKVDPTFAPTGRVRLQTGSGFPKLDLTQTEITTTVQITGITGCGFRFSGNTDGGLCGTSNSVYVEQTENAGADFSKLTLPTPSIGAVRLESNQNNSYYARLTLDADQDGDRDGTFAGISANNPTNFSSLELNPTSGITLSLTDFSTYSSQLGFSTTSAFMYNTINGDTEGAGINATTIGGDAASISYAYDDAGNNSAWTVLANGIQIDTNGVKPTCDATTVRRHYYTPGGAGVADAYEMCMKSAADTYAWVVIAVNP